ncbi:hypothetical protein CORC01_11838 [Colletotrichum orchidophilum]|uniref:Uncharacterized protein n=1 Tax=Colletotrichum orchidophilum TaxID=1209926 RepID=A0A1G4AUV0_9PEZI|nr:uncharacterized protein CORC01_11838 [Colletotrichum orchidophilum]OHE92832.1 hypothetical protein CORC01_11838 [Colletotrichum orchidophilum]
MSQFQYSPVISPRHRHSVTQAKHQDQSSAGSPASPVFVKARPSPPLTALNNHCKHCSNFTMSGPYSQFVDVHADWDPYMFEDRFNQNISLFGHNEYQSPYSNQPFPQTTSNDYIQPPQQQTQNETEAPPAKRLRSRALRNANPPRSTTPDVEPPYHLQLFCPHALPGTVSSLLTASLQIPPTATAQERARRESEIQQIFTTAKQTTLPPPSPRVKNTTRTASSSLAKIYKIRAAPVPTEIAHLPPPPVLGSYIKIDPTVPEGPARAEAVEYNNTLAAARLRNLKDRNNVAALRSRNRRDRAAVMRAEDICHTKAECRYWRAKAIAAGVDASAWEDLPLVVREAVAADYRIDALDFFQDVPRGENAGEAASMPGTPMMAPLKRKLPAQRK